MVDRTSIKTSGATVPEIAAALRPWAVQVGSGVESIRGTEDPTRFADFSAVMREAG